MRLPLGCRSLPVLPWEGDIVGVSRARAEHLGRKKTKEKHIETCTTHISDMHIHTCAYLFMTVIGTDAKCPLSG